MKICLQEPEMSLFLPHHTNVSSLLLVAAVILIIVALKGK